MIYSASLEHNSLVCLQDYKDRQCGSWRFSVCGAWYNRRMNSSPQADQDNWMHFDEDSSEPNWTDDDLDEDANTLDVPDYTSEWNQL